MFILNEQNTIANHYLAELRDIRVQTDRMRFRSNLERLGEILAYELSKTLPYRLTEVETPLGKAKINVLEEQPVLVPVLRAGLPFYQGVLRFFDRADSGFIGAFRQHEENGAAFQIQMDYIAVPSLEGKHLILIDPMLASGKSLLKTYRNLLSRGIPGRIDIFAVIAAPEGINYLKEEIASDINIWVGAIDEGLNDHAYIIPGLGDAGDLSFGEKI